MEPIFSRDAQVIGWLKNDIVYDQVGDPHAFVRNTAVCTFDGQYIGRFEHGFFRDEIGNAVAFVRNAQGWPTTPSPRVVPEPPTTRAVIAYATPNVMPAAHPPTTFWSEIDWSAYLHIGATAE